MFLRSRIRRLWTDSLRFHGKPCTLLALGVRVCDTAMTHLGLSDPGRDRLVCVSEHDGCCVDAIQIGLHCTSGRKHLLYYKTGRLIFTVYDLESGASVRICALPELAESIPSMTAQQVLSAPEDALFYFEEAHPLTKRVLDKVHRACNAPCRGHSPGPPGSRTARAVPEIRPARRQPPGAASGGDPEKIRTFSASFRKCPFYIIFSRLLPHFLHTGRGPPTVRRKQRQNN